MRRMIVFSFIFICLSLSFSSIVCAEQYLGNVSLAWYTEVWHHSGGYWTGNMSDIINDCNIGKLVNNEYASINFTSNVSKQVTVVEPFSEELNQYLSDGGNINKVKIEILCGNGKKESTLYVENSFSYKLNVEDRCIMVTFKPYYLLDRASYYLNFDMPKPHYDCDYIKFSIYHKATNQLLGVMAAKDDFDYNWIQGLSGELYHPDNPLVVVSNYGVEKKYHLNDLKIGNGTFKDGGAVGYFFTNSFVFEFSAPDPAENPVEPPNNPPDTSIPSLNVYFSISCNNYVATNNPDYPVYVDAYPVYLDLHMDYQISDNEITMVKLERKEGSGWVSLVQGSGPVYSHRYRTYRETETFRITVYTTRMDPLSVTASAYTKQRQENGIPFAVDFYLFDKNYRLVNDNYNNPIEVEGLPDTLDLLNVIPDKDPNFTNVSYYLQGNGKSETLKNISCGHNYNTPAKYPINSYFMMYLYNWIPPARLPSHYVFFKIVEPKLKVSATIEGYINRWDGGADLNGNILPENNHRFLCMEKVKVRVFTGGYADKVVIRFSPELEAMTYRPKGKDYSYDMMKDYGIEYTYFPEDTTFVLDSSKEKNEVCWEYYLPLAKDTLDWEGRRVNPSYCMYVYAYKGDKCTVFTIDDIEITGTVHDIIHIQPTG